MLTELVTREGLSLVQINDAIAPLGLRFFEEPRLRNRMSDLMARTEGCFLFGGRVCDRDGDQLVGYSGNAILHWYGLQAGRGPHGVIYDGTDETALVLEEHDVSGAREVVTDVDRLRHHRAGSNAAIARRKSAQRVMGQLYLKSMIIVAVLKQMNN